jgi:branched-chain amino acid transport system ATP-binding protein
MLVLSTKGVTKSFGGLVAVNKFDFDLPEGKIFSIIGPNGAGKTTLFNCITGFYEFDEGSIEYNGQILNGKSPDQIAKLGVSRTYQNIRLFSNMTAIENILVGRHSHYSTYWFESIFQTKRVVNEEEEALKEAVELLEFVGLKGLGDQIAINLPYGAQRRLEIARALANRPQLLLLDEPTAGMNPNETGEMIRFIQSLRDELGITILLIEHDMKVVMSISENIGVMDFGMKIAEGTPREIQTNNKVIEAYLGRGATANV